MPIEHQSPKLLERWRGTALYKRNGQERATTSARRDAARRRPCPRRVIPSSTARMPSPCGSSGVTAHSERMSDALLDGLPSVPARHEQGGLECSDLSPLERKDEQSRLVRNEQTRLHINIPSMPRNALRPAQPLTGFLRVARSSVARPPTTSPVESFYRGVTPEDHAFSNQANPALACT